MNAFHTSCYGAEAFHAISAALRAVDGMCICATLEDGTKTLIENGKPHGYRAFPLMTPDGEVVLYITPKGYVVNVQVLRRGLKQIIEKLEQSGFEKDLEFYLEVPEEGHLSLYCGRKFKVTINSLNNAHDRLEQCFDICFDPMLATKYAMLMRDFLAGHPIGYSPYHYSDYGCVDIIDIINLRILIDHDKDGIFIRHFSSQDDLSKAFEDGAAETITRWKNSAICFKKNIAMIIQLPKFKKFISAFTELKKDGMFGVNYLWYNWGPKAVSGIYA